MRVLGHCIHDGLRIVHTDFLVHTSADALATQLKNDASLTEDICVRLHWHTQKYISKPEARCLNLKWFGTSLVMVYFQTCCICRTLGNDDESPFRIITVQSLSTQPLLKLTLPCSPPQKRTPLATVRAGLLLYLTGVYFNNESLNDEVW